MGTNDAEGKIYLSNNKYFADAFNFFLYGGKEVIKENDLKELDTTGMVAPFANEVRAPMQRYRDIFRIWNAMKDDNAIYILLGAELQDKVHYGIPVKDGLYDMIGYSKQIEEIRRSYRKKKGDRKTDNGEISVDDGVLKVKMTSAEFLSGLRKGDKLIPIITLVVYLGDKEWDGPKSLHDMLDFKDNTLRRFVPDYKINLLSPKDLNDDDFKLFHTSFGFAMKMLKYRNNLAEKVISENGHTKVDRETAVFLNNVANLELEFDEEEGGIDMEGALDKCYQREKVKGAILVLKNDGASDDTIIEKVSKSLGVNGDYVRDLLTPKNNA